MRMLNCLALLIVTGCSFATIGTAQTFSCQPTNSADAVALKDYVVRLTSGDPALVQKRQAYQLPAVAASKVSVVKTSSVCQQAAQAYNRAVRGASAPQVSRSVVVIQVGTTHYVVLDPVERQGEFQVVFTFTSAFVPLKAFNT